MDVYVVSRHYGIAGGGVVGVYATRKLAEKAKDKLEFTSEYEYGVVMKYLVNTG